MSQTVAIIKSDCCERVYCAFGSRRAGFGVRIIWKYPQKKTEIAETPCIFPTREKALRWMGCFEKVWITNYMGYKRI